MHRFMMKGKIEMAFMKQQCGALDEQLMAMSNGYFHLLLLPNRDLQKDCKQYRALIVLITAIFVILSSAIFYIESLYIWK